MKALLLVDLQNDFMPGGALAVHEGFDILPIINSLLEQPFDLIIATKDWHPKDHGSFAVNQGKQPGERIVLQGLEQILWPVHCVQDSHGSEFAPGWDTTKVDKIIYKGTDKFIDSYSTFFDNGHRQNTGLFNFLKEKNIDEIYIAGLATDYCVKFSVLDAAQLGLKTYVVEDGCRGVNLKPDDSKKAFDEMKRVGATVIQSKDVIKTLGFSGTK